MRRPPATVTAPISCLGSNTDGSKKTDPMTARCGDARTATFWLASPQGAPCCHDKPLALEATVKQAEELETVLIIIVQYRFCCKARRNLNRPALFGRTKQDVRSVSGEALLLRETRGHHFPRAVRSSFIPSQDWGSHAEQKQARACGLPEVRVHGV